MLEQKMSLNSYKEQNYVIDLLPLYFVDPTIQYNFNYCVSAAVKAENDTKYLQQEVPLINETALLETGYPNLSMLLQDCLKSAIPENLYHPPYVLQWWQQLLWIISFGLMTTLASVGNAMVIWIISAQRRMRSVTNYFLLNLSVADLLMATCNTVFNFVFMLNSHWPFGSVYCVINNFIANLTVSASVFSILSMSIDRFVAIVRPLKSRLRKRNAHIIVVIIWICGSLLSTPTLLYSTVVTYIYPDGAQRCLCFLVWPDGESLASFSDHVYNIVYLVLTYAIPVFSMIVTYSWMGYVLWANRGIGECTDRQKEIVQSKKKVVHMMVAVVATFSICWLPYHTYFIYIYYFPEVVRTRYVQHVYLGFYWLAMSSSMCNPFIYYLMNSRAFSASAGRLGRVQSNPRGLQVQGPPQSRVPPSPRVAASLSCHHRPTDFHFSTATRVGNLPHLPHTVIKATPEVPRTSSNSTKGGFRNEFPLNFIDV